MATPINKKQSTLHESNFYKVCELEKKLSNEQLRLEYVTEAQCKLEKQMEELQEKMVSKDVIDSINHSLQDLRNDNRQFGLGIRKIENKQYLIMGGIVVVGTIVSIAMKIFGYWLTAQDNPPSSLDLHWCPLVWL